YAKLTLKDELVKSTVPDDPYLGKELYRYFPPTLVESFPQAVSGHRLRREIIATVLANAMINRGGPSFVNEITTATSADAGQVAAAYAAARDAFGLQDINAAIDALDNATPAETQLDLYAEVEALVTRATLWFLRNESFDEGLQPLIDRYAAGIAEIGAGLANFATADMVQSVEARVAAFEEGGVPRELA